MNIRCKLFTNEITVAAAGATAAVTAARRVRIVRSANRFTNDHDVTKIDFTFNTRAMGGKEITYITCVMRAINCFARDTVIRLVCVKNSDVERVNVCISMPPRKPTTPPATPKVVSAKGTRNSLATTAVVVAIVAAAATAGCNDVDVVAIYCIVKCTSSCSFFFVI